MPIPQRRMLHWAEPAFKHPLAVPRSSSPDSPSSVPAWARGPGTPNPDRNARPVLRGTSMPPARVSAQPGPVETKPVRSHSPNTHRPVSFPARGPASPKRKGLSRFRQSASGSAAFSSSSSPPYYGSLRRQRGILATAAAATGPTPPFRAGTSGGCLAGS